MEHGAGKYKAATSRKIWPASQSEFWRRNLWEAAISRAISNEVCTWGKKVFDAPFPKLPDFVASLVKLNLIGSSGAQVYPLCIMGRPGLLAALTCFGEF